VARLLAQEWDAVLAVGLLPGPPCEERPEEVPAAVAGMARDRDARRRGGDYPAADALRERIRAAGYDVVDAAEGPASLRKLHGSTGR
jgi:cysteinyl-tRNA synthetase